jgi:transcriptional regulator with XRE-family HTH domain
VRAAAELLGLYVKQARLERRWSVRELAERAGISTTTLLKIERGDPSVTLGVAFDVAALVGVPLFFDDRRGLAEELARNRDRVALLPRRVRGRDGDVDDDF